MKKLMILTMVAFSLMHLASAQKRNQNYSQCQSQCDGKLQHGKKGGHHKKGKQELMAQLNLSKDQMDKMKALREEGKKRMDELNTNTSITVKEFNDRKTAIRQDMKKKREAILTAEQKDQLTRAKANAKQKREDRFNQKLEKQKSKLGLSEEQVKQIKTLHEKNKAAMEQLVNDNKLNDQEKKMKIKALRKKAKEDRNNIYTKDQLQKIQAHQAQKKQGKQRKKQHQSND